MSVRNICLCLLLSPALGCGGGAQAVGKTMLITGAVVAAAAIGSSGDAVIVSDDGSDATIVYQPRHNGLHTEEAVLIGVGAGLMAAGVAVLNSATPPAPPARPNSPPPPPPPATAPMPPPTQLGTGVADPRVIEAACESVLEG